MPNPITETEREMMRLAEEAVQAGRVRRLPMRALDADIAPVKKGRGSRGGRPRKVPVSVSQDLEKPHVGSVPVAVTAKGLAPIGRSSLELASDKPWE